MTTGLFHFSLMTTADLPQVMAIERSTASPWSDDQMRSEIESQHGWQFVCRRHAEGEIIGFTTGTLVCDEADIRKLAVSPAHRRQKAATFLLEKLFAFLKEQGAGRCFLELRNSNHVAARLYHTAGLQVTGVRKGYYSDPVEDAILMTKTL